MSEEETQDEMEEVVEATAPSESDVQLSEVLGAMLFGTKVPLTARQMRNTLVQAAENFQGVTEVFKQVKEKQIVKVLETLRENLETSGTGLTITEVANGYRLQNDLRCGPWLRQLLDRGRPSRLSRPALETLSIIAYRQPATRSEIEAVRGVAVDAIVRSLMELQLIKVVGRSELPGKPWLFGTTQQFLEHFGLKTLDDLPGMDELKRREEAAMLHGKKEEEESTGEESPEPPTSPESPKLDADDAPASEDTEEAEDEDDEDEFDDEDED